MKMGILKKLIIGILCLLVIAFTVVTIAVNIIVVRNNDTLVSSLTAALEKDRENPSGDDYISDIENSATTHTCTYVFSCLN